MHRITATYKVITPLFISGADETRAELRTPSFKAALRFWYRATALSRLGSWQAVKEEEQKLFGSSDTGQGQFTIRLQTQGKIKSTNQAQRWNDTGSAYLGYGPILYDRAARQVQTKRPYINLGNVFIINILFKPKASSGSDDTIENSLTAIKKSLIALGLFGGLGARSRHGFGSLSLVSLKVDGQEEWEAPKSIEELQNALSIFVRELGSLENDLPDYTSFSGHSRISIAAVDNDPLILLNNIGKEMTIYKSYGKSRGPGAPHQVPGGIMAEQNFRSDHDLIYDFAHGKAIKGHPDRVVFGLPHNYFFSRPQPDNFNVNINAAWIMNEGQKEKIERRASPLFIHIHPLSGQYAAVLTLLPAVFLPPGAGVAISKVRDNIKTNVVAKADYELIHKFMNRFQQRLEVKI